MRFGTDVETNGKQTPLSSFPCLKCLIVEASHHVSCSFMLFHALYFVKIHPVCCSRHCPNNEKALFLLPRMCSRHWDFGQVAFLWQIRIYSSGWQMVKSDPSFRRMALNCTRVQRWGASHLSSPHMDCFVTRQLLK